MTMVVVFIIYVLLVKITATKLHQKVEDTLLKKYLKYLFRKVINFQNLSSPIAKILIMHL